jgi:hypothetical protein
MNINPMNKLDSKILDGYGYRNAVFDTTPEERPIMVVTGSGGAKLMVEEYRALGFPDEFIEILIEVFVNDKWIPLSDLKTKINK